MAAACSGLALDSQSVIEYKTYTLRYFSQLDPFTGPIYGARHRIRHLWLEHERNRERFNMQQRTGLPVPALDEINQPFLRGAEQDTLLLPQCRACGLVMAPPVSNCVRCWGEDIDWIPASGHGTIFSYVEYFRPWVRQYAPYIPYNVTVVSLDEGPRLVSNVLLDDGEKLEIDKRVRVAFEPRGETKVPVFVLAESPMKSG